MAATRASLISAVKTPLGLFSLIALVIEAMLGGLALKLNSANLGYTAAALLALLILAVYLKPDELSGKQSMVIEERFAVGFGEEFYTALAGYYDDLTPEERVEAYRFLEGLLTTSPHSLTPEQRKFCAKVAETVIRKANLTHR